jgi:hypothetical protein
VTDAVLPSEVLVAQQLDRFGAEQVHPSMLRPLGVSRRAKRGSPAVDGPLPPFR